MSIQKDDRRPEHVAQYIKEAAGEAAPAVESEPPANTEPLAEALGVDRDRLLRYVRDHPNPTAGYVLGWAGAEPDLREDVAEWLEAYGSAADRWEVSVE